MPADRAAAGERRNPAPSRMGQGCCGSVRLGRWRKQTAASPRAGACRLRRFGGRRRTVSAGIRPEERRSAALCSPHIPRHFCVNLFIAVVIPCCGALCVRGLCGETPKAGSVCTHRPLKTAAPAFYLARGSRAVTFRLALPCPQRARSAAQGRGRRCLPQGAKALRWKRARFGVVAGESGDLERFSHQEGLADALGDGARSVARWHICTAALPRGERRALPAPTQGTCPLRIPLAAARSTRRCTLPSQPPQEGGPCSWAVRRLSPLPSQPERNKARPPPARGAGARHASAAALAGGTAALTYT